MIARKFMSLIIYLSSLSSLNNVVVFSSFDLWAIHGFWSLGCLSWFVLHII
ncbi:hypothetical protein Scep_025910 [Stephania cephalantha]|uniref:Uncharacterized protein n=1 Tax=Stephania cephalantha TaxID=152367 RepID=A0AAP0HS03_9MAGN